MVWHWMVFQTQDGAWLHIQSWCIHSTIHEARVTNEIMSLVKYSRPSVNFMEIVAVLSGPGSPQSPLSIEGSSSMTIECFLRNINHILG